MRLKEGDSAIRLNVRLMVTSGSTGRQRSGYAALATSFFAPWSSWQDRSLALLIAFGIVTSANTVSGGFFHATAVLWLLAALPPALLPWRSWRGNTPKLLLLMGVLLLLESLLRLPGSTIQAFIPGRLTPLYLLRRVLLLAVLVLLWWRPRTGLLLGCAGLMLAAWARAHAVIQAAPSPSIDVWYMLEGASRDLLQGQDPYTGVYPSPHDPGSPIYPGPLFPHYVYLPVTLVPTMAGLLIGDVRWGFVAASLAAAGFLAAALAAAPAGRRETAWMAVLAAALMLRAPELPVVWHWSWSDPELVCLLALFLWSWSTRRTVLAGAALGALFASKQQALLFLPFALMLTRDRRFWIGAAATCAAGILPFVLADPRAFWEDAVTFHLQSPFRSDALNLTAWFWNEKERLLPGWAPIPPGLAILWLAWRRCPFGLSEFFQYSGAFYFVTLLTAKHAFMNYYHLIGAIWLIAAAASWIEAERVVEPVS